MCLTEGMKSGLGDTRFWNLGLVYGIDSIFISL
jgi:hypothetical protein